MKFLPYIFLLCCALWSTMSFADEDYIEYRGISSNNRVTLDPLRLSNKELRWLASKKNLVIAVHKSQTATLLHTDSQQRVRGINADYLNLLKRKTERGPAPSPQTEPRLRCIAPPYPPTGLCGYGLPRTPVPMPPGTGNAPPSSPVTSCPSSSWGRPQNTNSAGWTKPPAAPHKRKAPADFLLPGLLASCLNFEGFPLPLLWKPS